MNCNRGFVKNLTLTAQKDDAGRRLDRILRKALPGYPLSAIHRILRKGGVTINGKTGKGEDRIPAGALIELTVKENKAFFDKNECGYDLSKQKKQKSPSAIDIIWSGEGLLILNKPAGLAVHGGNGSQNNLDMQVQEYLKGKLPPSLSFRPGPLHRLDKHSSGIVVFALSLEAAKWFSALVRERKIRKRYLAILEGGLKKSEIWKEMLVRDKQAQKTFVAGGKEQNKKEALTVITPLAWTKKDGRAYTLAALEIETGRTHQIRSHAAYHGHPLAGDRKYGGRSFAAAPNCAFFLHACKLELPVDPNISPKIPRIIKAPLPEDFAHVLTKLFGQPCFSF